MAGMPVDDFSIRWTGQVQPLYSGVYTFYTTSDDGSRLYVNNQLVVNAWVRALYLSIFRFSIFFDFRNLILIFNF